MMIKIAKPLSYVNPGLKEKHIYDRLSRKDFLSDPYLLGKWLKHQFSVLGPLIRNQQASGSSPLGSSIDYRSDFKLSGFCLFGYY